MILKKTNRFISFGALESRVVGVQYYAGREAAEGREVVFERNDRVPLQLEVFATEKVKGVLEEEDANDWRAMYHNLFVQVWHRLDRYSAAALAAFRDRVRDEQGRVITLRPIGGALLAGFTFEGRWREVRPFGSALRADAGMTAYYDHLNRDQQRARNEVKGLPTRSRLLKWRRE